MPVQDVHAIVCVKVVLTLTLTQTLTQTLTSVFFIDLRSIKIKRVEDPYYCFASGAGESKVAQRKADPNPNPNPKLTLTL